MTRKRKPSGRRLPDKGKKLGMRPVNRREMRPVFLIVCEGEKTEPNYFRSFRVNADVEVVGTGRSPLGVVEHAKESGKKREYTEIWVVFDRDDFSAEEFNNAIRNAEQAGFGVAYSNQAFELWYLLHFDYHDTALSRNRYQDILTQKLGREYRKNDPTIYYELEDRQPGAIRNARRLLESYLPDHNPAKDDPCTAVHTLVERLNEHLV